MLHNGQLAKEYDETLKLSPGFDPVRAVDPALTLHAPLITGPDSIPGAIRAVFERNSHATYRAPRGAFLLSAGDDESRHEYTPADEPLGVLMEPANTNKCENWNANPDAALSNLVDDGDPTGVFSRVFDPDILKSSGLSAICESGMLVKVDNSAGSTTYVVYASGGTGNTNPHALSAFVRRDPASTGDTSIRLEGVSSLPFSNTEKLERIVHIETPSNNFQRLGIVCEPGGIAYFVLNQLEENEAPSSIIVTQGAVASRATDQLSWLLAGDPVLQEVVTDPGFDEGGTHWAPSGSFPCDNPIVFGPGFVRTENHTGQECELCIQVIPGFSFAGKWYEADIIVDEFSAQGGELRVMFSGGTVGQLMGPGRYVFRAYAQAGTNHNVQINLRFADDLTAQVSRFSVRELTPIFNQAEGMAAVIRRDQGSSSDYPLNASEGILNLKDPGTSNSSLLYLFGYQAGRAQFRSQNDQPGGPTIDADFLPDENIVIVVRWNTSANEHQIGFRRNGTWSWSSIASYSGGFVIEQGLLRLETNMRRRANLQHVHLWDVDRGAPWLEDFFEGISE